MRRLFVGAITNNVYGQFCEQYDCSEQPTPVRRAEIGDEPENPG
jgi:hypothetical protein